MTEEVRIEGEPEGQDEERERERKAFGEVGTVALERPKVIE